MKRFLVVTPNFNGGSFIEAAIQSVLSNKTDDDYYVLVDAGSTDESRRIIKQYSNEIDLVIFEKDQGYGDAIIKAFERAEATRFMCWINSNDLLLPNALNVAQYYLDSGNDLVYGDDLLIRECGEQKAYSVGDVPFVRYLIRLGVWSPLQDATFWKTDLFRRNIPVLHRDSVIFDWLLFKGMFGERGISVKYVHHAFSCFRDHEGHLSEGAYQREKRKYLGESTFAYYVKRLFLKPIVRCYKIYRILQWALTGKLR